MLMSYKWYVDQVSTSIEIQGARSLLFSAAVAVSTAAALDPSVTDLRED